MWTGRPHAGCAAHQRRLAAQQRRQRRRHPSRQTLAQPAQQGQQLCRTRPLAQQLWSMPGKGAFGNEGAFGFHRLGALESVTEYIENHGKDRVKNLPRRSTY
jgi:hypothetical protein